MKHRKHSPARKKAAPAAVTRGMERMAQTDNAANRAGGGMDRAMLALAALAAFAAPLLFYRNIVDQGMIKHLLVWVCATGILALSAQKLIGSAGEKTAFRWAMPDVFAAGFLLWSLLTVPGSLNLYESAMAWTGLAAYFVIYIYISRSRRGAGEAVLGALAASGAAAAAYTLVAATIVWRTRIDMGGDILYQMKNWLIAPMGGNNFTAAYLALGLPAACGLAAAASGGRRWMWAACGALQGLALGACLSRAAFMAVGLYGIALFVFFLAVGRRRAAGALAGAGALCVLLIGMLFYAWAGGGTKRLASDLAMASGAKSSQGAVSYKMRAHWWKDAARMGIDNMAIGVGYGGFVYAHPRYRSAGEDILRAEDRLTTPHNDYLQAFAESGAPGAALYAAMLFAGLFAALGAAVKSRGKDPSALAAAGVIGVAAVYGLADFPFQMPAARLAIFAALGVAGGFALEGRSARKAEQFSAATVQIAAMALFAVFGLFTLRQGAVFAAQTHVYKEIRLQDKPGEAIDEFVKAMRLDNRARFAHSYAGAAYYNAGAAEPDAGKALKLYQESISMFDRALEYDPYDYNAINFMGAAMHRAGRKRDAVEQFNRAIEIFPGFANPHRNLGAVWQDAGDIEKATSEFYKALELNGKQPDIYYELALMEEHYLRFKSAERLLKKALSFEPGNNTFKKELAKTQRIINLPINR